MIGATVNGELPSEDDKTVAGDGPKANRALPLGSSSHLTGWLGLGSNDSEPLDSLSPLINQVKDYSETSAKSERQRKAGNISKAKIHGPGDKDGEGSGIPMTLA